MASSELVSNIADLEANVKRREDTDVVMSFPKWFILSLITLGIVGIYVLYKLIKRRNEHFKRQKRVMENIESIVKAVSEKRDSDITLDLAKMSRAIRDAREEETEKSAALWVILSFVTGIAGLYIYYFLMKDVYRHSRRQNDIIEGCTGALSTLGVSTTGISTASGYQYQVPKRSFALYIILTIITLGIFGIYWLYVIFKDWNEHFKTQWQLEDEILTSIKSLTQQSK